MNVANAFIESLPKLSESQRVSMENPITLEELRLALSGMASGKTPGLDGIPHEFYETFWDIIGWDKHTVSLLSTGYKILSIVLDSCLRSVVNSIVHTDQTCVGLDHRYMITSVLFVIFLMCVTFCIKTQVVFVNRSRTCFR